MHKSLFAGDNLVIIAGVVALIAAAIVCVLYRDHGLFSNYRLFFKLCLLKNLMQIGKNQLALFGGQFKAGDMRFEGQPTGSVGLLCHMSRNGETSTETLSVDYDQKLVNGTAAIFNSSMITWTVRNGSENEHHELNRLTGTYNYWTDGKNAGQPMPTFVCVKAPLKF